MGLQFTFKGETIPQAHFILVKFTNSGNVDIVKEDFDEPISLNFGEKSRVLAGRIVKTKPVDLNLTFKLDGRNFIIDPALLNAKDNFTIEALVSDFDGTLPKVRGRIKGIKEIKDARGGLPLTKEENLVDEALVLISLILIFSIFQAWPLAITLAIVMLAIQVWRKLVFRVRRQAGKTYS